LIVPTTPLLLRLSSPLASLRLCALRFPDCARAALLRLRVAAADFVRDAPPEERDDPLRDEPLALCLLRDAPLLLLAIRDPSRSRTIPRTSVTRVTTR
jgi:hypothetical protein